MPGSEGHDCSASAGRKDLLDRNVGSSRWGPG